MADAAESQGARAPRRDLLEPCAPCAAAAAAIRQAMAEVAAAPADARLPAAQRHLSAALGIVSDVADGVAGPEGPPGALGPPGPPGAFLRGRWLGRQGGPLAGLPEDLP